MNCIFTVYQCTSHFTDSKLRLKSFYNFPKVILMRIDSEPRAISLNQARLILCLLVIQPFLLCQTINMHGFDPQEDYSMVTGRRA